MRFFPRVLNKLKEKRGSTLLLVLCASVLLIAMGVSLLTAANAVVASSDRKLAYAQSRQYARSCLLAADGAVRDNTFDAQIKTKLVEPAVLAYGNVGGLSAYTCSAAAQVPGTAADSEQELRVTLSFALTSAKLNGGAFAGGEVKLTVTTEYGGRTTRLTADYALSPKADGGYLWKLKEMDNRG